MSGYNACLASGIFIQSKYDFADLDLILDAMHPLAIQDERLREEFGMALCESISALDNHFRSNAQSDAPEYALHLLKQLDSKKEARSAEGLALWLRIQEKFPNLKMPKHIWHHRDPWSQKEWPEVIKILKKATKQGSAQPHFLIPLTIKV